MLDKMVYKIISEVVKKLPYEDKEIAVETLITEKGKMQKDRSTRWIQNLARKFETIYADKNIKAFYRSNPNPDCREFLYDISIGAIKYLPKTKYNRKPIAYMQIQFGRLNRSSLKIHVKL